jgi:glycosyltransferase involved in cell wall biosynthesis
MKWITLASFGLDVSAQWYLRGDGQARHVSEHVPKRYVHDRSRKVSGLREWSDFAWQSISALPMIWRSPQAGVLTFFPQLAALMALLKWLGFYRRPLVAWSFNMGRPYRGWKGQLARWVLSEVDLFVVYSKAEIEVYSQWLQLPQDRFEFLPLTSEPMDSTEQAPTPAEPYVLAMGTANRDYRSLFDAVAGTAWRVIVISGAHALRGLEVPSNVQVMSAVPIDECRRLARGATVNVIPIADVSSASGQVTLIDSMHMGCSLVVTRCIGTVDYVQDRSHALLVPAADATALRQAIGELWVNPELREKLAREAASHARRSFTNQAVRPLALALLDRFG